MTAHHSYGRIGALLQALSEEIELLGTELCLDPDICARHLEKLQQIDRIAQTQRALATVILSDDVDLALASVALDHVRAALMPQSRSGTSESAAC